MPKRLLIATLGTSPAVITEAIDLLAEQEVRIDGVFLLMTQDRDVQAACELLSEHLPSHDKINWIVPLPVASYADDVDNREIAVEFMQEACKVLKMHRDVRNEIFVSIAGGRKVMSALLALAAQFYGANRLFHVWVPPWIEERGEIDKLYHLRSFPDRLNEVLHPPLTASESDRPRLVDLPFIGLFPLLPEILAALQSQSSSKSVKDLLVANGLLTSAGQVTALGESVAYILQGVESLPPVRQEECRIHISSHHYKNDLEQLANRLCNHFVFIYEIRSIEWSQGENKVKAESPNLVNIYIRRRSDVRLGLQLVTTATTSGQLEATRKAVERFIQNMNS